MSGSSGRAGAKALVKEKPVEVQGKRGLLRDLFPSKSDALVPARRPIAGSASDRYRARPTSESIEDSRMTALIGEEPLTEPSAERDAKSAQKIAPRFEQKTDQRTAELKSEPKPMKPGKKVRLDTIRVQETVVGPKETSAKPDVTSASQLRHKARTGSETSASRRPKQQSNSVRYALLILAIAVIGFAVKAQLASNQKAAAVSAEAEPPSDVLNDRVAFHREEVGRKLNRERLNVQYQNGIEGARLPQVIKKVPDTDMLIGVPLVEESAARERSRDRHEQVNPSYADTYVQYSLQEQQQINEWEKTAQKEYVDEFIANAARAGYKVKVDKLGNVSVVGRYPAAQGANGQVIQGKNIGGPSGGGSIH
jgi:hypothetical protein